MMKKEMVRIKDKLIVLAEGFSPYGFLYNGLSAMRLNLQTGEWDQVSFYDIAGNDIVKLRGDDGWFSFHSTIMNGGNPKGEARSFDQLLVLGGPLRTRTDPFPWFLRVRPIERIDPAPSLEEITERLKVAEKEVTDILRSLEDFSGMDIKGVETMNERNIVIFSDNKEPWRGEGVAVFIKLGIRRPKLIQKAEAALKLVKEDNAQLLAQADAEAFQVGNLQAALKKAEGEVASLKEELQAVNDIQDCPGGDCLTYTELALEVSRVVIRAESAEARLEAVREALQAAYRKHCMDDSQIGWNELSDILHNALCELMGDEDYEKWKKAITGGGE